MRMLLTLLATSALTGLAGAQTSIKSGLFADPTTWDTGLVPGPFANVVISAGHTVGLTQPAGGGAYLNVAALTVDGTLVPSYPPALGGKNLRIVAANIVIHGEVRAEDAVVGAGGRVWIQSALFPNPFGIFENDGMVRGGTGVESGGGVWIDAGHGLATNNGLLRGGGGRDGGNVGMLADVVVNTGDMIGGAATTGFAGNASLRAGRVPTFAQTLAHNLGVVRGGDAGTGGGGDARVSAFSYGPLGTGTAINDAGALIVGGNACEPGDAELWASTASLNVGTMRAGVDTGGPCSPAVAPLIIVDPPTGEITGGAILEADVIHLLGGDLLTIGGLTADDAIHAHAELRITVAPGGVLDLSGMTPGKISAPAVALAADDVQLPAGMTLDEVFGGAPVTWTAGATFAEPRFERGSTTNAAIGEAVPLPLVVENLGNTSQAYWIDVIAGTLGVFESTQVTLGPGERWQFEQELTVTGTGAHKVQLWVEELGVGLDLAEHVIRAFGSACWSKPFGAGDLHLHVEPGAAVTAPFLAIDGSAPFAPVILAFSATPYEAGLLLPGLTTLYLVPDGLTNGAIALLAGPTGKTLLPVSLQHPTAPQLHAQAFELSLGGGALPHSNGLTLQFCQ